MNSDFKTCPQIIWHFSIESGDPCSWPLNLGSVMACQIEYGESDATPCSELGLKKLVASACLLLGYSFLNPATMFWGSPSCPWRSPAEDDLRFLAAELQLIASIYFLVMLVSHLGSIFSKPLSSPCVKQNLPCWALHELQIHELKKWFLWVLNH